MAFREFGDNISIYDEFADSHSTVNQASTADLIPSIHSSDGLAEFMGPLDNKPPVVVIAQNPLYFHVLPLTNEIPTIVLSGNSDSGIQINTERSNRGADASRNTQNDESESASSSTA